jgi:hypothetical protein
VKKQLMDLSLFNQLKKICEEGNLIELKNLFKSKKLNKNNLFLISILPIYDLILKKQFKIVKYFIENNYINLNQIEKSLLCVSY